MYSQNFTARVRKGHIFYFIFAICALLGRFTSCPKDRKGEKKIRNIFLNSCNWNRCPNREIPLRLFHSQCSVFSGGPVRKVKGALWTGECPCTLTYRQVHKKKKKTEKDRIQSSLTLMDSGDRLGLATHSAESARVRSA